MAPIATGIYAVSPQYKTIASAPKDHYQFLNVSTGLSAPELYVRASQSAKPGDLELKLGGATGTGWAGTDEKEKPETLRKPLQNYGLANVVYE